MSVLHRFNDGTVGFTCPGCRFFHKVWVDPARRPCWAWNGDLDRPTFELSIRVQWEWGTRREPRRCHFYVRDGRIEFCADSTHDLAGQTVTMSEIAA